MGNEWKPKVVIVGSGFGGLGLGIQLKRAGFDDFVILEKEAALGGTWRDNSYPGAACDVPSFFYSFSFAQKRDWTRKWAPQPEIYAYTEELAREHGLISHLRLGSRVTAARFDAHSATWTVHTQAGDTYKGNALVMGVGQLHEPLIPDIPGRESFRGKAFHSARWDHAYDLRGKRVAVIGNAASAIQFIPQIAPLVKELWIFQRTPNWMLPRGDRAYTPVERWLFRNVPGWMELYRFFLWLRLEALFYPVIRMKPWAIRLYKGLALKYLAETVRDSELRRKLVPDYPPGAKRILISDDYYQTLNLPHVHVITDPIERITESAIVARTGASFEVDAIVFATGFRTNPFLAGIDIEGLPGHVLARDWAEGARAYYGITVPGYPNFFLLYGPNTNLGHNSILFMLECQFRYIVAALRTLQREGGAYLDVRPEVFEAFYREIQEALQQTAWARVPRSWYKDSAGRITNNWPYSTFWYWWKTHRLDPQDYRMVRWPELSVRVEEAEAPALEARVAQAR